MPCWYYSFWNFSWRLKRREEQLRKEQEEAEKKAREEAELQERIRGAQMGVRE